MPTDSAAMARSGRGWRGTLAIAGPLGLWLLLLTACGPPAGPSRDRPPAAPAAGAFSLERVPFSALPGWRMDRPEEALVALRKSCAALAAHPPDKVLGGAAPLRHRAGAWRPLCADLARVSSGVPAAAETFLTDWFVAHRVRDGARDDGLFTGYFEPQLRGSLTPTGPYRTPLYRRPPDLIRVDLADFFPGAEQRTVRGRLEDGRLTPYFTRAAITSGALAGRGLELLWVDDPIDAFFLQIQGSGRVALTDGTVIRVGYADQNGHPYYAIGRALIRRGALTSETVSLQSIDAWLRANPQEAAAVMNLNPSFIFFHQLDGPIVGAQGVPLTPGRSLAVDRAYYPLGLPVWIDVADPLVSGQRVQRLMVAQDTGGAIKGPIRGDVFWGHGPDAKARAGRMKSRGRMYVLVPTFVPGR